LRSAAATSTVSEILKLIIEAESIYLIDNVNRINKNNYKIAKS
jgi:hypothetical protein